MIHNLKKNKLCSTTSCSISASQSYNFQQNILYLSLANCTEISTLEPNLLEERLWYTMQYNRYCSQAKITHNFSLGAVYLKVRLNASACLGKQK